MEASITGGVAVVGAMGMLAGHLLPLLAEGRCKLVAADLREGTRGVIPVLPIDITDETAVARFLELHKPDWLVNCAAYTAVDLAETERNRCFQLNAYGPGILARCCRELGVKLVHISSDYVFGGGSAAAERKTPYVESDSAEPCGIYGLSKWLGDELVVSALPNDHLILRTSWLHGLEGPSFLASMLKISAERSNIKVVNDQVGSPTWAGWLAATICKLIEHDARGIFHASSHGGISWYDFAIEIFSQAGRMVIVEPMTSQELSRPAPRPPYSTLGLGKLESFLGEPCPNWRVGVSEHLRSLSI